MHRPRGSRGALFSTLLSIALALSACGGGGGGGASSSGGSGGGSSGGDEEVGRTGTPDGWPSVMSIAPAQQPALYLEAGADAPPIGFLGDGARVRIDGPPRDGRVPVTVGGALSTRGWVPVARLRAYVNQRGRIDGTPTYLGVNDAVDLLAENADGSFRVAIRPWLGRSGTDYLGPFEGNVPRAWIVGERSGEGDPGLNPGENRLLPAGQDVPVYDRPNGQIIATLPAADPPHTVVVLRSRDGWSGIRAGVGPYLVGYVQGELAAATEAPRALYTPEARAEDQMPRLIAEQDGALWRVASGTRIRFWNRVIGRVRGLAWARELGRPSESEGMVDVLIAVDDGAMVRGLVPSDALTSAREGDATP